MQNRPTRLNKTQEEAVKSNWFKLDMDCTEPQNCSVLYKCSKQFNCKIFVSDMTSTKGIH